MSNETETYDWNSLHEKYAKEREAEMLNVRLHLREKCETLKQLGIHSVVADYDGSGDEGYIDNIQYEPDNITVESDVDEELLDLFYKFLPAGWDLDDGTYGRLVLDVDNLEFEHEQHVREMTSRKYEETICLEEVAQ